MFKLCVCVLVTQSWLTLCDPMDLQPTRLSSVHGILQVRILQWAAMSSSRVSFWTRDQAHASCITGGFVIIWATRETLWLSFITGGIMDTLLFFFRIFLVIPAFCYLSIRTLKLIFWKIFQVKIWCQAFFVFVFVFFAFTSLCVLIYLIFCLVKRP